MDKFSVLRQFFGYNEFRNGQETLVDNLLQGRDVLGIMPTGAGKSICYQVPAILMKGITIVVSPLISLMKDQVNALVQQGINSAYINSSLTDAEYDRTVREASMGKYKIIYVAPERLLTGGFLNICQVLNISMVAIDEAHCVSQWGQDFRPSYLNIKTFINNLPYCPVVGAFTATATSEVRDDVIKILELNNPEIITTGFDRPNLYFSVMKPDNKNEKLLELLKERRKKSGIIYCSTRKNVENVCNFLIRKGFPATRYHAGLDDQERAKNQDDFVFDRKPVMVATNAFGMGIDKSNVSYVIHYNMPKNIESYYQEAGRAGRDGTEADCILLYARKDIHTNQYFIDNMERNPQLTDEENDFIRKREEARLNYMTFYCTTSDCLRKMILQYFGDELKENCGKCSNCLTKFETVDITIDAQKILSCIIRTGQRFGINMIADVLMGKTNEKIRSAALDKQSTYGIMKDTKATDIKYIIEKLIEEDYITEVGVGNPVLKVTEMSAPVLRGTASIKIQKTFRLQKKSTSAIEQIVDSSLFEKLRSVRAEFARKKGVPAFLIFSDATLSDMCLKLPVTLQEFMEVNGVGENKLEQYGDKFMEVISEYKKSQIHTALQSVGIKPPAKEDNLCDEKELQQLVFLYNAGTSIDKLSQKYNKPQTEIIRILKENN